MELNGLDRYCLYNLSLNLIDLRIFSVIHDLILCLCLLNLIFFVGRNVSFAFIICFSIMSYVSFGFPCESVFRWLWRKVALRPSLKLLIAVSLRVFTVMNLGGVVLVCEIQMLVKQGRWSDMLLITTPDEVLLLLMSWCIFGFWYIFDRSDYNYLWQTLKVQLYEGRNR